MRNRHVHFTIPILFIYCATLSSGYQFVASRSKAPLIFKQQELGKFTPSRSSQTISKIRRTCHLKMHMGHSHSHHHDHGHSHSHSHSNNDPVKKSTPINVRRKITRVFFAAAATLLPSLILKKRITSTNTAIFILTSTALSFTERMRSEVKFILSKARNLRDGLKKHAPTEINASKYLFRNENAADRVTLLGVVVNLLLSVGKAIIGVTCNSSALIADAGHSLR